MTDICNCQAVTVTRCRHSPHRGAQEGNILCQKNIEIKLIRGEDTRVTAHWRHYLAIHQTHVCIIDWRDTSVMCGLIIITIITHYTLSPG